MPTNTNIYSIYFCDAINLHSYVTYRNRTMGVMSVYACVWQSAKAKTILMKSTEYIIIGATDPQTHTEKRRHFNCLLAVRFGVRIALFGG